VDEKEIRCAQYVVLGTAGLLRTLLQMCVWWEMYFSKCESLWIYPFTLMGSTFVYFHVHVRMNIFHHE